MSNLKEVLVKHGVDLEAAKEIHREMDRFYIENRLILPIERDLGFDFDEDQKNEISEWFLASYKSPGRSDESMLYECARDYAIEHEMMKDEIEKE